MVAWALAMAAPRRFAMRAPLMARAATTKGAAQSAGASALARAPSSAARAPATPVAKSGEEARADDEAASGTRVPHAAWSEGFDGIGQRPFSPEISRALLSPLKPDDVEIKPGSLQGFVRH